MQGVFGFRKNGTDKIVHCSNAEPECFLEDFVNILVEWHDKINERFDSIKFLTGGNSESKALRAEEFEEIDEWAKALEDEDEIVIRSAVGNIKNSLFCKFGYIYNFDKEVMEFWLGSQFEPDLENRFGQEEALAHLRRSQFDLPIFPCKCVRMYSLRDLNSNIEEIIDEMNELYEKASERYEEATIEAMEAEDKYNRSK